MRIKTMTNVKLVELRAAVGRLMYGNNRSSADYNMLIDFIDSVESTQEHAIEVVRCQNCIYYKEYRTKRNKQLMCLCYRMGRYDMEYPVKKDDFCSYGKRKQ